jgi:LmbE family N-acetylglucosaminyl deacetylase/CheY-like chemotaxis protein
MTRPLHILLVEDDPSHARLVQRWLAEHEVTWIDNGLEGNATAWTRQWDLVITDVEMPGMDGLALLEHIKAQQPDTPVLVVTGKRDVDFVLRALDAKAEGYLFKPLTAEQLRDRVTAAMATRRRAQPRSVLAIGAHPDDVEIGCGGAILSHVANGDRVTVLTMSRGRCGGDTTTRASEAAEAARRMGVELVLEDFPDTRIDGGPDVISCIGRLINQVDPDIVYTHTHQDTHQDHRGVHAATLVAARGVPSVLCYQSPSTTIGFQPTRFTEIAPFVDGKLHALHAYASQAERAYLADDLIASTARYWGRFAGYGSAEPMEVVRDALSR